MRNYIVIALPVIDYPVKGYTPNDQRLKLYEEIEELLHEAEASPLELRNLLSEYMDVGQMIAGVIRSQSKETLAGEQVNQVVFDIMKRANEDHLLKMERYARERGWAILSGNGSNNAGFRTSGSLPYKHPFGIE